MHIGAWDLAHRDKEVGQEEVMFSEELSRGGSQGTCPPGRETKCVKLRRAKLEVLRCGIHVISFRGLLSHSTDISVRV